MEKYLRVNLLGPGPLLMKKIIYQATVSQKLRNTGLVGSYHSSSKLYEHGGSRYRRKFGTSLLDYTPPFQPIGPRYEH